MLDWVVMLLCCNIVVLLRYLCILGEEIRVVADGNKKPMLQAMYKTLVCFINGYLPTILSVCSFLSIWHTGQE